MMCLDIHLTHQTQEGRFQVDLKTEDNSSLSVCVSRFVLIQIDIADLRMILWFQRLDWPMREVLTTLLLWYEQESLLFIDHVFCCCWW